MRLLPNYLTHISNSLRLSFHRQRNNLRVWRAGNVQHSTLNVERSLPVIIFNASTRLTGISQNAAFSLLAGLSLQMAGVPVVNFACQAGMSRCPLGVIHGAANHDNPLAAPPCKACIAQSRPLFSHAPTVTFEYRVEHALAENLRDANVSELENFEFRISNFEIPLGQLVLPSLRWVLRRHHLADDEPTRFLFREFIQSAYRVAVEFDALLEQVEPRAVIVFNGQFFPEAAAKWAAKLRGVQVITHEVGLRPFSAFFTTGEATAYPLHIPADFELNEPQNRRLDEYLSQRMKGQFSMAGIQFWPEMSGLGEDFLRRAASFRQIVPVFTNVIFDTSQPHANVVFEHMFAWLDLALELARNHPDTLFVLRAHPDEARPGKESRESVAQWVAQTGAAALPNILFVDAGEPLSSYELIQRSKFVMLYNSTIGLEASILGAVVLCGGRARFTQLPTVFFPQTVEAYRQQAEEFLAAEKIAVPAEFARNARRFLYYQLYRSSLPFADFIEEDGIWPGFVRLKKFPPEKLIAERSLAMRAIVDGVLHGGDFMLTEDR